MLLYSDSRYPVRNDLAEPGTSGTGAQRLAIAANFSRNDRIANGRGIPVDPMVLKAIADICARPRLDDYRSAVDTFSRFPEART